MMTDATLFFIFSSIECFALLTLICAVFSIPSLANALKLYVISLLFTCFSYTITVLGFHSFNIAIQIPVVILIFKYVFHENNKYSIWISVTGYIFFMMVEGVLATVCMMYGLIDSGDIRPFSIKGYALQCASSAIILLIGYYVSSYREGYIFNFDNEFKKKRYARSGKLYVWTSVILFALIAVAYPSFFYSSDLSGSYFIAVALCFVSFALLMFLSAKRNKEEINSLSN